jgi:hypothetical protein
MEAVIREPSQKASFEECNEVAGQFLREIGANLR